MLCCTVLQVKFIVTFHWAQNGLISLEERLSRRNNEIYFFNVVWWMFAGFLVVGSLSALGNFSLNGWTGMIVHWLSCLGVLTAVILWSFDLRLMGEVGRVWTQFLINQMHLHAYNCQLTESPGSGDRYTWMKVSKVTFICSKTQGDRSCFHG